MGAVANHRTVSTHPNETCPLTRMRRSNGVMTYNGKEYPTKGASVGPCNFTIQYSELNFTDPQSFRPERWLGDEAKTIDRNAWRPFELGPRACMGREMVMDEMRTILLLCVRWFDFEVTDDGSGIAVPHKTPAVDWARMDLLVGDLAFQELGMEAKPRHGMPMKVKRTERPL
jgi:cytochrome P450